MLFSNTLAQIIDSSVNNKRAADDGGFARQGDLFVGERELGNTIRSSFNVSEISNVAFGILKNIIESNKRTEYYDPSIIISDKLIKTYFWTSMSLFVGVEVRAGRDTSIGTISILMDVEAVLSWLQSLDLSLDGDDSSRWL